MTNKELHIVCLDVPYPVDYGGVFDLFYKIKELHSLGVLIHLHCFEHARPQQEVLNNYCRSVTYYKREEIYKSLPFRLPFIVRSRANPLLLKNLSKDNLPVLLEGIHCTYYLFNGALKNRKIFVRLHNVEYEYYEELAKATKKTFRKLYFTNESRLLKIYESELAGKAIFLAVSKKDKSTYESLPAKDVRYLPVFLPFTKVETEPGSGDFCLYHGNLSVPENEKAALWLIKNVFDTMDVPFVIAGRNPSNKLKRAAGKNENICLIANPSSGEMEDLVKKAHINVLPSFNKTGVKIKLLNALFNGRFIVTNPAAIEGSDLETVCKIAGTSSEYKKTIADLLPLSFSETEKARRNTLLMGMYDSRANALSLMQWIW